MRCVGAGLAGLAVVACGVASHGPRAVEGYRGLALATPNAAIDVGVADGEGKPVSGRPISVFKTGPEPRPRCAPTPANERAAGTTNATGHFIAASLVPGDYTVWDDRSGVATKASVGNGEHLAARLEVSRYPFTPRTSLTPRPDSVPFTRLAHLWARGPDTKADVAWIESADELRLAPNAPVSPPAIDFTQDHILAVRVMGNACTGTDVVGVYGGPTLRLETRAYREGCVNILGPTPTWSYLLIARCEPALQGVPLPSPSP